jgi:hypothetical protein
MNAVMTPVYPGMTCHPGLNPGVKFRVDVSDETGETVASRGLGSDDLDDGEEVGPEVTTYLWEYEQPS